MPNKTSFLKAETWTSPIYFVGVIMTLSKAFIASAYLERPRKMSPLKK
jgi:hypothetical protein